MTFLPQSLPASAPATLPKSDSKGWELEKEEPTTVEDQVQDQLRNLKMHKSMGHDEMHPQV